MWVVIVVDLFNVMENVIVIECFLVGVNISCILIVRDIVVVMLMYVEYLDDSGVIWIDVIVIGLINVYVVVYGGVLFVIDMYYIWMCIIDGVVGFEIWFLEDGGVIWIE